jgi:integrase
VRALTFGAYLTSQWLPAKRQHLATSTYRGYERNVQRHILPALGTVSIRRLRYQQIEALYDVLLHPTTCRGLAAKTVYEIHLIVKGALADALRRGVVTRNVAVVARAPKQRSLQRVEGVSLTEEELRQLMRTAVGHRLFPLLWLTRSNDCESTCGWVRFHDLRHTHATLLLKAGVPLKVVSERLGHSTPAFTMTVYQHVLPGMQRDAADLFARLVSGDEDAMVAVAGR